jgi:phospholipase C
MNRLTEAVKEVSVSYNSSANVYVTNNSGGNADITLSHRYSDDTPQIMTWSGVGPGATTQNPLVAGFNTGFLHPGLDYWWIGIQVSGGQNPGRYNSEGSADNPGKECYLSSKDNGKNLAFSVDTKTFLMGEISGPCTTGMSEASSDDVEKAKAMARASAAKAGR